MFIIQLVSAVRTFNKAGREKYQTVDKTKMQEYSIKDKKTFNISINDARKVLKETKIDIYV